MALLSMMRNYGSTSSTSPRSFASGAASSSSVAELFVEDEKADATRAAGRETAEEEDMMKKKKQHLSFDEDDGHNYHHRGEKRSKTGFMVIPAAYSFLLVSLVMAITMSALIQPIQANPTCILNCVQCVKIYGDFFDGHKCAKVCMDSQSNKFDSFVDCADPTTIARFLKSF